MMRIAKLLLIPLIGLTVTIIYTGLKVYAHPTSLSSSMEPPISTENYKTISSVIKEYERIHQKKLVLPKSFPFRVNGSGSINGNGDRLELEYYIDNSNLLFKIFVRPPKDKLKPIKTDRVILLKDGTKAILITRHVTFAELRFQKYGWDYSITIDKRKSDSIDMLFKIAESY